MAKLKATPKSFTAAAQVLNGRDSMRLGNNTYLEKHFCGIAVRLHSTNIVMFHEDGRVALFTGGYYTVTTKERINQFISGRVYQKKHVWYYVGHDVNGALDWEHPVEFSEGMDVGRTL